MITRQGKVYLQLVVLEVARRASPLSPHAVSVTSEIATSSNSNNVHLLQASDKCLVDCKKKLDAFMEDMAAPPKLFFFYQPRQFKKPELFCSLVGDGEKLEGKCVYFLRCSTKPIKQVVA